TLAVDLSFVGGGRASWALYLVCEWTFGALLVLGARDLTGAPAVPLRRLAWLLVPALAAALALSRLPGNFNALFQVQAGIM
ncbi:hypothetical protein, partial [Streptomyces turgidiscabies]|uniref:hypothetical protein n=1 Tax=Streptomyces turgidiscabies TaxID=85558 RepID=UPI0038F7962C